MREMHDQVKYRFVSYTHNCTPPVLEGSFVFEPGYDRFDRHRHEVYRIHVSSSFQFHAPGESVSNLCMTQSEGRTLRHCAYFKTEIEKRSQRKCSTCGKESESNGWFGRTE